MTKEQILLNQFLEGSIPDRPGMRLDMKKSGKKDDECLYFNLPLEKDREFYAVHWGQGRRAAALYTETEFEKLRDSMQDICHGNGPGRRYARMLMLSAHFSCYKEKLGFYIRPILLNESLEQWEYVEISRKEMISDSADERTACPFAIVGSSNRW